VLSLKIIQFGLMHIPRLKTVGPGVALPMHLSSLIFPGLNGPLCQVCHFCQLLPRVLVLGLTSLDMVIKDQMTPRTRGEESKVNGFLLKILLFKFNLSNLSMTPGTQSYEDR